MDISHNSNWLSPGIVNWRINDRFRQVLLTIRPAESSNWYQVFGIRFEKRYNVPSGFFYNKNHSIILSFSLLCWTFFLCVYFVRWQYEFFCYVDPKINHHYYAVSQHVSQSRCDNLLVIDFFFLSYPAQRAKSASTVPVCSVLLFLWKGKEA